MLVALSAAAGVVLPESPAGLLLQASVGTAGGPLVAAWSIYVAVLLIRRRPPKPLRVLAYAILSLTWLLVLALREPNGGGMSGETLLGLLDAGFGRTGGLALISLLAAGALVGLIGLERILECVAFLGRQVHRLAPRRQSAYRRAPRTILSSPPGIVATPNDEP
ncbi:MAG: hypothetical protein JOY61_23815, partial [Chloroflexi bacterium]|nr:hypothetical protein [Chloroflexota bacterium]